MCLRLGSWGRPLGVRPWPNTPFEHAPEVGAVGTTPGRRWPASHIMAWAAIEDPQKVDGGGSTPEVRREETSGAGYGLTEHSFG